MTGGCCAHEKPDSATNVFPDGVCASAGVLMCASPDTGKEEQCLGEVCDERCIEAAAAIECKAACARDTILDKTLGCCDVDHARTQEAAPVSSAHKHAGLEHAGHEHAGHDNAGHDNVSHEHAGHEHAGDEYAAHEHRGHEHAGHKHSHDQHDNHQWDACSTHLQAAFDRYTRFLEQALCICKKIQAEHSSCVIKNPPQAEKQQKRASVCSQATSTSSEVERMPHGQVVFRHSAAAAPGCCKEPVTAYKPEPVAEPEIRRMDQQLSEKLASLRGTDKGKTTYRRRGFFRSVPKEATLEDVEMQQGSLESVTFSISGMDCSGCGNIVRRAFANIPGVRNTCVTFIAGSASCDIDTRVTSVDEVMRLVERATKYKIARVDSTNPSLDLILDAQQAQDLARSLPKGFLSYEPIGKGQHRITYDSAILGARKVIEMIPGASLAPPVQDESFTAGQARLKEVFWKTVVAFCLTIPVVVLSWASSLPVSEHTKMYVSIVLATFVQIISIPEFYQPALSALVYNRVVEMDMLVVLSISAAYGYSIVAFGLVLAGKGTEDTEPLFETSTLLISLILLGRLVAAYARKRAVAAVSLRSLQPATAMLVDKSGETIELDARLLELGDTISVAPHTQIVTDGTVLSGCSDVDESMITGEAIPVAKYPGDIVTAGTLNTGGTLSVTIHRLPGRNTVTDIANLVEQAQSTKPRVQDLADKVAGYFIPVVLSISTIVTIIWVVVELKVRNRTTGYAFGSAITYGIAVLAVSCPCALGLAVPMVLVIAGGVAARSGIIIKTADVVERGFKCTDVVFDKTGTLTENALDVVEERLFERPGHAPPEIERLVRAMVYSNRHPISKAIDLALEQRGVSPLEVSNLESIPGAGVQGVCNGATIRGGSPQWLGINHTDVTAFAARGLAIYCVADDSGLLAAFGLKTTLRKEAKSVVQDLQARQVDVHIVSGDGNAAVEAVAQELGILTANIASKQTPGGKQNYIRCLQDAGKVVMFVGDGTNDAIAVTEAAVGVQIESSSDITRATADVVLLGNLKGVPHLLDISKAAFHRIMFNFLWAALYNVFAILLAGGAFVRVRIPPAYAGLGELVSVVPVVLTAATLLRKKFVVADEQ